MQNPQVRLRKMDFLNVSVVHGKILYETSRKSFFCAGHLRVFMQSALLNFLGIRVFNDYIHII